MQLLHFIIHHNYLPDLMTASLSLAAADTAVPSVVGVWGGVSLSSFAGCLFNSEVQVEKFLNIVQLLLFVNILTLISF